MSRRACLLRDNILAALFGSRVGVAVRSTAPPSSGRDTSGLPRRDSSTQSPPKKWLLVHLLVLERHQEDATILGDDVGDRRVAELVERREDLGADSIPVREYGAEAWPGVGHIGVRVRSRS